MIIGNLKSEPRNFVTKVATDNGVATPGFYIYAHGTCIFNESDFKTAAYVLAEGFKRGVVFVSVLGKDITNEFGETVVAGSALSYYHHFAFIV